MSQTDSRYHKKRWRSQAKLAKQLTRNRCCLCGKKATEVHHAYYGVRLLCFTLPIAGFEIPGWQVFPLCDRCHSNSKGCAHNFDNYQVSKLSPWFNCNRYGYLWRLRIGFLITFIIVHPLTAVFIGVGVWLFASTTFASGFSEPFLSRQFPHWQSDPSREKPENRQHPRWRNLKGSDRVPTPIR